MGLEESMSPRSCSITWHSFSPWHNLSKSVLRMSPRSCCILLFTLQRACYTRSVCFVPAKRLFIVVNVVFVVFPPQQAIRVRERARGREGVPIVWRISFSRHRGRVARGKPWGFALPLYAGRVAGAATGADVAARAVATSRRLAARWAVRPCRPAPWISRPACRRPGLRRYPGLRRPWWPS